MLPTFSQTVTPSQTVMDMAARASPPRPGALGVQNRLSTPCPTGTSSQERRGPANRAGDAHVRRFDRPVDECVRTSARLKSSVLRPGLSEVDDLPRRVVHVEGVFLEGRTLPRERDLASLREGLNRPPDIPRESQGKDTGGDTEIEGRRLRDRNQKGDRDHSNNRRDPAADCQGPSPESIPWQCCRGWRSHVLIKVALADERGGPGVSRRRWDPYDLGRPVPIPSLDGAVRVVGRLHFPVGGPW